MLSLFLSPGFPPNAYRFCTALRLRGATVVGIGDAPPASLPPELVDALAEYVYAPTMGDPGVLRDAVAAVIARHGPIAHLDSNGEHWLAAEAELRDRFGVPGLGTARSAALRSKLAMAEVFAGAGIPHPPGIRCDDADAVRAFAAVHGFPLVFKPDTGSGAVDTFPVASAAELEIALARPRPEHVVQPFVTGDIVTFDGLTDAAGTIVFCTAHAYDTGIMQVRRGELDGYYYSLRDIPPALEAIGRRAVAAFDVRAQFFHLEFFATPAGYVALEVNLRPPGGFTTDMMCDACELDIYDLWAAVVTRADLTGFTYRRPFHAAHAGRRAKHTYRHSEDELVRLLGPTLVSRRAVPEAYAETMGNVAYLLRHAELDVLLGAIALVQARPGDG